MEKEIFGSHIIFIFSILLGIVLRIIYDFFKIFRFFFKKNNLIVSFIDIFYFIMSSVIVFLFILIINKGYIRFFILFMIFSGWLIYHFSVGKKTFNFFIKFIKIIKKIKVFICKFKKPKKSNILTQDKDT